MLFATLLLGAAAITSASKDQPVFPPWPLEGTRDYAKAISSSTPLQQTTGLKRDDYINTIDGVVQFFRQYQDATGHIVDPYRGMETQYSTPCFAFACATVFSVRGGDLLPNCTAAVTAASLELATKTCADGHCVFFMKPLMFAYRTLVPLVDAPTKAIWDANLEAMNPWVDFAFPSNNWGLVGTLDMLRTDLITKFGNSSWWTAMLDFQLSTPETDLTGNGLYQDHTGSDALNPLPYDTFPVSGYLTVILREGYVGPHAPLINETTRRAAWTHMLMQSPWGEIPTGGRSSQHTWNEAVSTVAYEIIATEYAAIGDMQSACMFQRAAHLSHASVKRWQNPSGSLQIVKNHFDPSLRWGYEDYSYLTNYNLLPASMLAAAYLYADHADAIPECAAPADVGGFVFLLPEHHLVIANAGGVYIEIETAGDPNYDPIGWHRTHINTCGVGQSASCVKLHTLLGPTAGPPLYTLNSSVGVAIGPWWSTAASPDNRTALAELNYTSIAGVSLSPDWNVNASLVSFKLQYFLLVDGAIVTQSYVLSVNGDGSAPAVSLTSQVELVGGKTVVQRAKAAGVVLSVEHVRRALSAGVMEDAWIGSAAGTLTRFGLQYPAFLFDGVSNTTVQLDTVSRQATVTGPAGWGTAAFTVQVPPPGHNLTWVYDDSMPSNSRNGLVGTVWVETTISTGGPSLTASVSATN